MWFRKPSAVAIAIALLTGTICHAADDNDKSDSKVKAAERIFALMVLPLIKTKCVGCHGGDEEDIKGDYDMRSRAATLKGGESEEASIVPGKPEESPLYRARPSAFGNGARPERPGPTLKHDSPFSSANGRS